MINSLPFTSESHEQFLHRLRTHNPVSRAPIPSPAYLLQDSSEASIPPKPYRTQTLPANGQKHGVHEQLSPQLFVKDATRHPLLTEGGVAPPRAKSSSHRTPELWEQTIDLAEWDYLSPLEERNRWKRKERSWEKPLPPFKKQKTGKGIVSPAATEFLANAPNPTLDATDSSSDGQFDNFPYTQPSNASNNSPGVKTKNGNSLSNPLIIHDSDSDDAEDSQPFPPSPNKTLVKRANAVGLESRDRKVRMTWAMKECRNMKLVDGTAFMLKFFEEDQIREVRFAQEEMVRENNRAKMEQARRQGWKPPRCSPSWLANSGSP